MLPSVPVLQCPVCSGPQRDVFRDDGQGHTWNQCGTCALWWESVRDPLYVEIWYEQDQGIVPSGWVWRSDEPKIARTLSGDTREWRKVVDGIVSRLSPEACRGTLLEVGCGSGDILDYVRELGHWSQIVGTEIGRDFVAFTRSRGHDVRYIDIMTVPVMPDLLGTCNLVIANELMEHVRDPVAMLRSIAYYLTDTGVAFVSFSFMPETPTSGEWQYWSLEAICQAAVRSGLRIARIEEGPTRWGVFLRRAT